MLVTSANILDKNKKQEKRGFFLVISAPLARACCPRLNQPPLHGTDTQSLRQPLRCFIVPAQKDSPDIMFWAVFYRWFAP